MARTEAQKKAVAAFKKRLAKSKAHIAKGGSRSSWETPSKKKGGSKSNKQRTTTKPVISKVSKPSLAKDSQLDILFILKNYFGRLFNKRMTVNVEDVPRTILTRGRIGPPIEKEINVINPLSPSIRKDDGNGGGGGGGRRKPAIPIIPVQPITPTKPSGIIPNRVGYYSTGKTYAPTGANRLTLYFENNKNRRVGSKLLRKIDGYYIVVKKNKKKVRLRTPLLTLNDAIDLLAYKLDNNLIRIGEVVRYGKTNMIGRIPRNIKGYFVKNQRKFAIIPLRNGFNKMLIERRAYAKDKPGERKRRVKKRVVKRRVKKKKVIKRKKPVKRKRKK